MSQIPLIAIVAGSIGALILGGFAINSFSKKSPNNTPTYTPAVQADYLKMDNIFNRDRAALDNTRGGKRKTKRNHKFKNHKSTNKN